MTTNIENLLSRSSESLASKPVAMPEFLQAFALGPELVHMLQQRNGFYAFEAALHVFPLTTDPGTGLEAWNAGSLWRDEYGNSPKACCFLPRTSCRISSACLRSKVAFIAFTQRQVKPLSWPSLLRSGPE